ncbi:MAG: anaerobic sulfatase maturase, partial [Lachnospiraceae bacterium]|nr:anaerobic sulfatase maturase [Lachnospiraceae bacterium]
ARHEEECLACPWNYLCRGGCRRDREPEAGAGIGKNYFCPAYKEFLPYAKDRLIEIGRLWIRR